MTHKNTIIAISAGCLSVALLVAAAVKSVEKYKQDYAAAAECQSIKKAFEKDGVDRAVTNALAAGIMIDSSHTCTPK